MFCLPKTAWPPTYMSIYKDKHSSISGETMVQVNLSTEVNELHADICSALADPSRILIIYALSERPYMVNDLAAELNISQPTASRH